MGFEALTGRQFQAPRCWQTRHVASAATEIKHAGGICCVNAREQIDGGTQARLGKLEILLRVSGHAGRSSVGRDEVVIVPNLR